MFWVLLIAMATIWFLIPKDSSTYPLLDEKPKNDNDEYLKKDIKLISSKIKNKKGR